MRFLPFILLLFTVGLVGCQEAAPAPTKADALAQSDPDARARQLLTEFDQAEDQKAWVQQNQFALTVFETAKDPSLKSSYETKIKPLLGQK